MESPRGRPGPETDLLALGEQQAAIFGDGPGQTPSERPSGLRLSEVPAANAEDAEPGYSEETGFGWQNTVESKVRLAPFVCLPWKHQCVFQEAGLKGCGSLCWAHSPSVPQADPTARQNSP